MKIVGISLVKNEERFLARVLANALALCDSIEVMDNGSTDATRRILRNLKRQAGGRIRSRYEPDLLRTHEAVQPYIGTDTWVLGLDGDEIYDPEGLWRLRERILSGEFADDWMIRANFCHVHSMDLGRAQGWLAPPSQDPSKLYNMRLLRSWPVDAGRALFLNTEDVRLQDGGTYFDRHRPLNREHTWTESPFRCLHMRFMPRSSVEPVGVNRLEAPRLNPDDVTYLAEKRAGVNERLEYRRGEEVSVKTAPFGLGVSQRSLPALRALLAAAAVTGRWV